MSFRGGMGTKMKIIVVVICLIQIVYGCRPGQVERWNGNIKICCYPNVCRPGQKFSLCQVNDEHDTCQNCPKGYGHQDLINTSDFLIQVDPCTKLEDCSVYSDLREEQGKCVCDRTRGYFGHDRNLCFPDPNNGCKKAGYQLTQSGYCEECKQDYFKDLDDYSLCKEKTRCEPDQEINDPGSNFKDRTCRKKISQLHFPQPITKNVTSIEREIPGARKNFSENFRLKDNPGHNSSNVTKRETDKNESDSIDSDIIFGIVVGLVVVILCVVCIGVGLKLYRKYKNEGISQINNQENDSNSTIQNYPFSSITCCVGKIYSTNNYDKSCLYDIHEATGVSVGNHSTMTVKDSHQRNINESDRMLDNEHEHY